MKTFIYPYKVGSNSVKNLKDAADLLVIKRENSKFSPSPEKIVINWGSSMTPDFKDCIVVNEADAVALASNKLNFFNHVGDNLQIPEFTTDQEVAKSWLENGKKVLARETLTGHSGSGIYVINSPEEWNNFNHGSFKIYVKYIPKKDEYRIHVFNGEVIDEQRKAIKADLGFKPDFTVRTHKYGFVFVRETCNAPDQAKDQAIKAVSLCGLDFGAVDVIWNEYRQKAYVLEVNTAPGLEGATVESYQKAIEKFSEAPKKKKLSEVNWHNISLDKAEAIGDPQWGVTPMPTVSGYHIDIEVDEGQF